MCASVRRRLCGFSLSCSASRAPARLPKWHRPRLELVRSLDRRYEMPDVHHFLLLDHRSRLYWFWLVRGLAAPPRGQVEKQRTTLQLTLYGRTGAGFSPEGLCRATRMSSAPPATCIDLRVRPTQQSAAGWVLTWAKKTPTLLPDSGNWQNYVPHVPESLS